MKKKLIKINLIKLPNDHKSFVTFSSLFVTLGISLFILFDIKGIPTSSTDLLKLGDRAVLISIIWRGGSIINNNINVSKVKIWWSYGMTFLTFAYMIFLAIFVKYYDFFDFRNYLLMIWLFMILTAINWIWTLLSAVVEKKKRPYFTKHLTAKLIYLLIEIVVVLILSFALRKYVSHGEVFNYREPINLFVIFLAPFLLFGYITSFSFSLYYLSKFNKLELSDMKKIAIWNAFIRIASLSIWAISQSESWQFQAYEYTYLIMMVVLILTLTITAMSRLRQVDQNIIVLVMTTFLTAMSILGFVIVNNYEAKPSLVFWIFILFVLFTQLIFIVFNLSSFSFFFFVFSIFTYLILLITFIVWSSHELFGEINFLNINQIIWGLMTFLSTTLMIGCIVSAYLKTRKISKYSKKIIKINRRHNEK